MSARIEDAEDVEIGRVYDVPAVCWVDKIWTKPRWADWTMPIFGVLHEDKEIIGFPDEHWHVDWRFVSTSLMRRIESYVSEATYENIDQVRAARVISKQNTTGVVLRRRMRLKRTHLHFPSHVHSTAVKWMPALEDAYAEASAKCGRCPHRGMSLVGAPMAGGARVCPGHGLAWNVETGKLQRRTA